MKHVEFRETTTGEDEALASYFWRNGHEIDGDIDVRIWKCDYFAVCIAGPMKLPYAMKIDCDDSENVLIKEQTDLRRIPLKFMKPKVC
ncbi:unnamed protein product [Gongylonema pulchrum]|uniref:DUF4242 domain-containing protein n=1 Tax=Gongylonema pulchrum TaxID=637853 RepID=A0A183DYZ4_9BILA|nr:unnamed protein product [Gongylonema pulchrum]